MSSKCRRTGTASATTSASCSRPSSSAGRPSGTRTSGCTTPTGPPESWSPSAKQPQHAGVHIDSSANYGGTDMQDTAILDLAEYHAGLSARLDNALECRTTTTWASWRTSSLNASRTPPGSATRSPARCRTTGASRLIINQND